MQYHRGFTLIELVLVIVLIGVLAVTAAPRFFTASGYDQIAARDELIQLLRQAQLQSMNNSTECQVVHFKENQSRIPSSITECAVAVNGEQLLSFDNWGRPNNASGVITIPLSGESAVQVCIETEGYIHAC